MLEMYTIEQLAAFAEYGTFSKVAEVLHTSQPAISRSMRKLEDELGVNLFDRGKNRIALNSLGELAARQAQLVISAHDALVRTVQETDRRRRTFSLGSIAPAPVWELTPILSQLFMGMTVSSDLQETEDVLLKGLDDGTYNLVVLLRPPKGTAYFSQPFFREHLSVLLPGGHRLASRKILHLRDLAGESILIHNKIGFWYSLCRKKIPNAVCLEQSELSALREIVKTVGLPSFTTNMSERDGIMLPRDKVVIPLADKEVDVQFYCVCKSDKAKEYAAVFSALKRVQKQKPCAIAGTGDKSF